jgi:hypothetical protein
MVARLARIIRFTFHSSCIQKTDSTKTAPPFPGALLYRERLRAVPLSAALSKKGQSDPVKSGINAEKAAVQVQFDAAALAHGFTLPSFKLGS